MTGDLWRGPFSPELENSFLQSLGEACAAQPLQPKVVLVGSNLLGLHLRHALAQETGDHSHVRFLTFIDLAETFTRKDDLEANRQAFPRGGEELMLSTLAREQARRGLFTPIADQEGFARALRTTFHDLLDGAIKEIPPVSDKLKEINRLFQLHRRRYQPRYFTTADRLFDAATSSQSFSELFGTDTLYVYGFYDLTEVQRRLLHHCAKSCSLKVWLPFAANASPFVERTYAFFKKLQLEPHTVSDTTPTPVVALSAPGEYAEAEETVRWLLQQTELTSTPLHRVAILLRHVDIYDRHFAEVLERAGVPYYRGGGRPFTECRIGKALQLLTDMVGHEGSRPEILRLLTFLPLSKSFVEGCGAPGDWDRWSREALVTRGAGSFIGRLSAYALHKLDSSRSRPMLQRWIKFLRGWFEDFERLSTSTARWDSFSRTLAEFLDKYLEDNPEKEFALELAHDLGDLVEIESETTPPTIRAVFRRRCREARMRDKVFDRDGLYLGSMVSARAIAFDMVCIPGLVERQFPAPPRPDPLLLDRERARINQQSGGEMVLKETRLAEERALFDLAQAQAQKRVLLSYPRLQPSDGRERLPSSFLLQATQDGDDPIDHRPLLRWNQPRSEPYLDKSDWLAKFVGQSMMQDRTETWSQLLPWSPFARSVKEWVAHRFGMQQWTPYDGIVGPPKPAERTPAPLSPSEIKSYATCPYQYYLHHVLRFRPLDEPEEIRQLRPLDRGTLIHEILFRFYTELRNRDWLPLPPKHRTEIVKFLHATAHEVFAEMEDQLPLGPKLLWQTEKGFILSDLEGLLDLEFREAAYFRPYDFEVRFGMRPTSETEGRLSTDQPVEVDLGKTTARLRGKIDRIDLSTDGRRARVIDYKTGALDAEKDDAFQAGKAMQLPVYLAALPTLLPEVQIEVSEARLLSTSYGSGFRTITFSGSTLTARQPAFRQILSVVQRGVARGLFPPKPGSEAKNCRVCDYASICGTGVERAYERKRQDPKMAAFEALEEIK